MEVDHPPNPVLKQVVARKRKYETLTETYQETERLQAQLRSKQEEFEAYNDAIEKQTSKIRNLAHNIQSEEYKQEVSVLQDYLTKINNIMAERDRLVEKLQQADADTSHISREFLESDIYTIPTAFFEMQDTSIGDLSEAQHEGLLAVDAYNQYYNRRKALEQYMIAAVPSDAGKNEMSSIVKYIDKEIDLKDLAVHAQTAARELKQEMFTTIIEASYTPGTAAYDRAMRFYHYWNTISQSDQQAMLDEMLKIWEERQNVVALLNQNTSQALQLIVRNSQEAQVAVHHWLTQYQHQYMSDQERNQRNQQIMADLLFQNYVETKQLRADIVQGYMQFVKMTTEISQENARRLQEQFRATNLLIENKVSNLVDTQAAAQKELDRKLVQMTNFMAGEKLGELQTQVTAIAEALKNFRGLPVEEESLKGIKTIIEEALNAHRTNLTDTERETLAGTITEKLAPALPNTKEFKSLLSTVKQIARQHTIDIEKVYLLARTENTEGSAEIVKHYELTPLEEALGRLLQTTKYNADQQANAAQTVTNISQRIGEIKQILETKASSPVAPPDTQAQLQAVRSLEEALPRMLNEAAQKIKITPPNVAVDLSDQLAVVLNQRLPVILDAYKPRIMAAVATGGFGAAAAPPPPPPPPPPGPVTQPFIATAPGPKKLPTMETPSSPQVPGASVFEAQDDRGKTRQTIVYTGGESSSSSPQPVPKPRAYTAEELKEQADLQQFVMEGTERSELQRHRLQWNQAKQSVFSQIRDVMVQRGRYLPCNQSRKQLHLYNRPLDLAEQAPFTTKYNFLRR